jgi:hypothetical protein
MIKYLSLITILLFSICATAQIKYQTNNTDYHNYS